MSDASAETTYCRNCNLALAPASARFCSHCGQETAAHIAGFFEYFHELINHYVALEGKLWRTLWYLFTRPGFLTTEYFAGRRQRYVRPFRLYFSISLVFFLLVKVAGVGDLSGAIKVNVSNNPSPIHLNLPATQNWGWLEPLRPWIEASAAAKNEKLRTVSQQVAFKEMSGTFISLIPNALFLFLPLYALILKLVYFDRRRSYGEHMITTLNTYAMFFFTLLLAALQPYWWLQSLLLLWAAIHVVWELKRIYGGSWMSASWRSTVIGLVSAFPAMLLLAIVAVFAMLT